MTSSTYFLLSHCSLKGLFNIQIYVLSNSSRFTHPNKSGHTKVRSDGHKLQVIITCRCYPPSLLAEEIVALMQRVQREGASGKENQRCVVTICCLFQPKWFFLLL